MKDINKSEHLDKKSFISAYIITKNEEKNIGRALDSVKWMDEIVIIDSGSTDKTVEIAEKYGAKVTIEAFNNFIEQKNRAMELCTGEWLFNLDADEEVTPELRKSIEDVILKKSSPDIPVLFKINRKNQYMGHWIKHCGWYPEFRTRLSRKGHAKWSGEVLHEKLEGDGPKGFITGDILHRPYANLGEHLRTIDLYSELWAKREVSLGRTTSFVEILIRTFSKFFKMYILKAGFMDYMPGLFASIMGAWYTFMKYARLYELSRNLG